MSVSRTFAEGTVVVVTIAANIGYTGIIQFECAFPDSLIGITPDDKADNVFLECYLQTQQPRMDRMAPRGTQRNTDIQFLKPWPVLVPPQSAQRDIVAVPSSVDTKTSAEEQRRAGAALKELVWSALEQLMTDQIRLIQEDDSGGDDD